MGMNLKKRSCDRCHERKEVCTGSQPCTRCEGASVSCEFSRIPKRIGRPPTKSTKHLPLRKYSRKGCIPCKKQKKKCDEDRPACQNCIRKLRPCSYINEVKEETAVKGSEWFVDLIKSEEVALPTPGQNFEIDVAPSNDFNYTEKMFLDSLLEVPLNLLGLNALPTSCSSTDTVVELYEEQKFDLLTSCMINSVDISDTERNLLCYFISEVSPLLFADKTTTRFLTTVVPLCLVDSRVRYPILAIAASHRVNADATGSDYEVIRDSVLFRAKAQNCLVDKNDDFYDDTENVLLSLCLVSIQEIFEGNSLYWSSALEKGADIIRVRGGLTKVSKISPLSIQLFCYLDLISSLSTCATPYVDRSKNNPYSDYNGNHIEDILNCKFGFKFGIGGELFKIMGNISTLAGLRGNRYKSPEHDKQFDSLANLIEMKLQNWSPPLLEVATRYQIDENAGSGKLLLSSYSLALQWSCFLRLHQIREGYNRRDSRITACLSIILKSLRDIENNTELETGLLFPLVMAGLITIDREDRNYILSRIRSIKGKLQFSYIGEFEKLLLLVWSKDIDEGDSVNWAKIRYYQFSGLVMF